MVQHKNFLYEFADRNDLEKQLGPNSIGVRRLISVQLTSVTELLMTLDIKAPDGEELLKLVRDIVEITAI